MANNSIDNQTAFDPLTPPVASPGTAAAAVVNPASEVIPGVTVGTLEKDASAAIVSEASQLGGPAAGAVAAMVTPQVVATLAKALASLFDHIGKPIEVELAALLAKL